MEFHETLIRKRQEGFELSEEEERIAEMLEKKRAKGNEGE